MWHFICIQTERHILHKAKWTFVLFGRNLQLQQGLILKLKFFHVCWWVVKQQKENAVVAGAQSKSQGWGRSLRDFKPVLSRIHAPECVLGSVQTRYTGRKTVRNDTKKAAGIHRKGGLSTSNNNYHKFLLFAKSVLNGHRMLRSVTFLPSSTLASPSAFLFDFTHCGVWGHHVWWVQGLLLWRRRSHAEYIIPAISGKFAGDAFDEQREQTSQTQQGRFPGLRRLCTYDGVSTAESQRRQTPVRISAHSAAPDKLQPVAPANHTLTPQANIYLDCLYKYIL